MGRAGGCHHLKNAAWSETNLDTRPVSLVHRGEEHIVEYQFVMRCWERGELDALLVQHGFGDIRYFGAYDADVEAGATDRLVTVARRAGER